MEESVPPKFHNRFQKSEKGIDIEICCDALRLASTGRMERLFLLSNDGDFIPLCKTLKEFGTNISILHLSDVTLPNDDLLREADSYDVVSRVALNVMFLPQPAETEQGPVLPLADTAIDMTNRQAPVTGETLPPPEPESEKPEAEPSDLNELDGSEGADVPIAPAEPK